MLPDDPVVERVRSVRRAIVERCRCEPHGLLNWLKQIESQSGHRVIGYDRASHSGEAEAEAKPRT